MKTSTWKMLLRFSLLLLVAGCRLSSAEDSQYCFLRNGAWKCSRCTEECSEEYNQEEASPCTSRHDRTCHCKAGFYCPRENIYQTYCHKPCLPCGRGTYSSAPSLNASCSPHTHCGHQGLMWLRNGTATRDAECGLVSSLSPPPHSRSSSLPPPPHSRSSSLPPPPHSRSSSLSLHRLPRSSSSSQHPHSRSSSSSPPPLSRSSSLSPVKQPTTHTLNESRREQMEGGASPWQLPVLMLLMLLLLMSGFCFLGKRNRTKVFSKCSGIVCGKNEAKLQKQNRDCLRHQTTAEALLSVTTPEVRGQSAGVTSGPVQKVSLEHSGRGENVSNTVGSIYIYSPGTVILGSNTGEKEGVSAEDEAVVGVAQQESLPPLSPPLQEHGLSFPVPVTGK